MIGVLLILPSPWTVTSYYKWLCERIALPDGMRLIDKFESTYRSWSIGLAIGPLAGCRSIVAFLRPDLRGHKACRFVEAGGPPPFAERDKVCSRRRPPRSARTRCYPWAKIPGRGG
jgi:hypothetical protein